MSTVRATPFGSVTLPEFFHFPHGLVVFLVVLMAVGGFAGATWVEGRFRKAAA